MPAGVAKRGRGRPPRSAPINSFAKVSKTTKVSRKKEPAVTAALEFPESSTPVASARPPAAAVAPPLLRTAARKRKAQTAEPEGDNGPSASASKDTSSSPVSKHTTKRARCSANTVSSPPQQLRRRAGRPGTASTGPIQLASNRASSTESDLSAANDVLERLRLSQSPASQATTPVTSDSEQDEDANDVQLPGELIDLVSLFTSFLKTLSLHASYNGGSAVEMKALAPDLSRSWGRRTVEGDDIRLLLGVMDRRSAGKKNIIKLADYGRNKLHLEISSEVLLPLPQKALVATFSQTLRLLWAKQQCNYFDARAFTAGLPRANIVKKPVARLLAPQPRKGQQTLAASFNKSIADKKAREEEVARARKAALATPRAAPPPAATTKPSVLDRVREKQAATEALLAAQPSPEQTERRRRLQRVGDVAAVLGMLCASSSSSSSATAGPPSVRLSFPMTTVVEKLKDSLRSSIAADEAIAVVEVIAADIAPEWLFCRHVAGREYVIMDSGAVPAKWDVERRVEQKLAV